MELREIGPADQAVLEAMLGHLNFSTGASDPQFLAGWNRLFEILVGDTIPEEPAQPTWQTACRLLEQKLAQLKGTSAPFQDTTQAERTLMLLREVLPAYRQFHHDLLFQQHDDQLFRPYFLGRVCETILQQADVDEPTSDRVRQVIAQLNDFVGYRPVPVLEGRQIEVYPHERLRPIPVYLPEIGAAVGPGREVIERALELIRNTSPDILRVAHFDPNQLRELAIDPRAYDFEHPVNKRPNYHFGQWDPHAIDNRGLYYRFVIPQVTLDAILSRFSLRAMRSIPRDELITEAAAVLAGTILMAAGVSGSGPETFDSTVSLGDIVQSIARYRDSFYEMCFAQLTTSNPDHAQRLAKESQRTRQPFGGARQHLNTELTRRRAAQLERIRLATLFARMGYPEAAQRQIDAVPVASARMLTQINCQLTLARSAIQEADLQRAARLVHESYRLLLRGIECGAIVDPWNIIGFDGNFSLFPALENTVHDERVDDLLETMSDMFDTHARLWSAACAHDDAAAALAGEAEMERVAKWWHQFAVHEVGSVDFPDSLELLESARNVAEALRKWHQSGEETGAIPFWAPLAQSFQTPKAYAMVLDMLLDRGDLVAARALLINWLDQAEDVPLEQGEDSFEHLAFRWMADVLQLPIGENASALGNGYFADAQQATEQPPRSEPTLDERVTAWQRVRKFFDYLEANAGELWRAPAFDVAGIASNAADAGYDEGEMEELDALANATEEGEDDGDAEGLFDAAYENVVYRDSTDDGIDSSLFDSSDRQAGQLDLIHDQVVSRLSFLNLLARLRRLAILAWLSPTHGLMSEPDVRDDAAIGLQELLGNWLEHSEALQRQLRELLLQVSKYRVIRGGSDFLSMADFDRDRTIKESMIEHVIGCCVQLAETELLIRSLMTDVSANAPHEEELAVQLLRAALAGKSQAAHQAFERLSQVLERLPILYVPAMRGGDPLHILSVRIRQQLIRTLLQWMPRLGMLTETRELVDVARSMERGVPVGPGSVTEFDELFQVGFRALVDCIIRASNVDEEQDLGPTPDDEPQGPRLVSCLESMTESMLLSWLSHSRTLRLSVLEKVKSKHSWQQLVRFVKTYGEDLFTQTFLNLANLRSILFQGVDHWLRELLEMGEAADEIRLLRDLEEHPRRFDGAVEHLTLVIEAIVENYPEYRDYNSTTTQSDRGDMIDNLLDFLRLLSRYERVVWNLKPVAVAHELLVRRNCHHAAQMWRRALAERIAEEADRYQRNLTRLQNKYAMRMTTIAERIGQRFMQPLIVDRMRALVKPALLGRSQHALEILEEEATLLMREPSGIGIEVPYWLMALEEEVHSLGKLSQRADDEHLLQALLPSAPLTVEQVQRQISSWTTPP